jgi:hypothetical protein
MMLAFLASELALMVGAFLLGWYARGSRPRRVKQTTAPVRHRMQEIDTAQIVTAELLAEQGRSGVPWRRRETPNEETPVANPKRRTTP